MASFFEVNIFEIHMHTKIIILAHGRGTLSHYQYESLQIVIMTSWVLFVSNINIFSDP